MRKAGLVVWKAHEVVKSMISPGVTTGELDAAVERLFEINEATPLFKGVPGRVPFPAVTCISINEEVVHGIPGPRRVLEGDVVSVDTGCRLGGWCGDASVTHLVGQGSAEAERLVEVTQAVLDLAISLLCKKTWWTDIALEMEQFVHQYGFSVVESFVGHGIGRNMHEPPQVPNFVTPQVRRRGDFRLAPGLVLAIEPMVNVGTKRVKTQKDHWTQATADGSLSAHFEHTVAITKNGPFVLTGPPQEGEDISWLRSV